MYVFSTNLAELTLFWFCFNCVDFRHILLSKYLAFKQFDPQKLCMEIYCNFSYQFFYFKMTLPQTRKWKENYFVASKII